jgi:hypothetical protein
MEGFGSENEVVYGTKVITTVLKETACEGEDRNHLVRYTAQCTR